MQVNLLVGRQVASFFDGAVSWLSYADRLYQLPPGGVGVAIGVVLLPDLSRRLQGGDDAGGRGAANRAAGFSLALTLPAAVALVAIPLPLVSVLFERGAFTDADSAATALAVAVYGLGLPAFVLTKVVSPVFFAREDTRTPFRIAVVAMIVNAGVAIGGGLTIGYLGAALGTTVAAWVNLALLWRAAGRFGAAAQPDARLRHRVPRLVLASLVMGAGLLAALSLAGDAFVTPGLRYLALAALVAGGASLYAASAFATGAVSGKDLRRCLRGGGGGFQYRRKRLGFWDDSCCHFP